MSRISHGQIANLFGANSQELAAAKFADQYCYQGSLRTAPTAADSSRMRNDRWRVAQHENGHYESQERDIMRDPLFDKSLAPSLERVHKLVEPRTPDRYAIIEVKDRRAQHVRYRTYTKQRLDQVAIDKLQGNDIKNAVAAMIAYQKSPTDVLLRSTVSTLSTSNLFKCAHGEGTIKKIAAAFETIQAGETGAPTDIEIAMKAPAGLGITAHIHNEVGKDGTLQSVSFALRTVPNAIIAIDAWDRDNYPAHPMTSGDIKTQRADAEGNVTLAGGAGYVRILDPNTLAVLHTIRLNGSTLFAHAKRS